MPTEYTRRDSLKLLTALATAGTTGALGTGTAIAGGHDHDHDFGATLNRFATTVTGAEFTGMFVTRDGQLFFNVQHPGEEANESVRPGAIGAVAGCDMHELPDDFESVQPPKSPAKRVKTARGSYQVLAEGGETMVDGEQLGVPYSATGEPMTGAADPDYNGFVPIDGSSNEGHLFTNWEDAPGMVSRLHISQSSSTGKWTVHEKMNVDFHDVEGTWNNCFGTVSPWGTPLTSEEYEPDAKAWFEPDEQTYGNREQTMKEYLGKFANAYRYGYIVEIEEPHAEEPKPVKHFTMGRYAHENAVVMPDRRTAYMSDDGTGTVFFKFAADVPGDLSAGTLYAAKAKQQGPGKDPRDVSFGIDWIELAHASDEEIESWIAEYDDQDPNNNPEYITESEVKQWAAGNAEDDRVAFLESRKAAAALGATDEFRKMEGTNVRRNAVPGEHLYMAMSEINETMLANSDGTKDEQDHVQLEQENHGAVYRMRLDGRYNVHRMEPVIVGGEHANICGGCPYDAHPGSASSVCQDCAFNPKQDNGDGGNDSQTESDRKGVNKLSNSAHTLAGKGLSRLRDSSTSVDPENTIANPDNIVVMDDGRVVVGEDSDIHRPNMLWVYAPEHWFDWPW